MWIMTNNSFVSAVQDRHNPEQLCVRARIKGDLESLFGDNTEVSETHDSDYRFRTFLPKTVVAETIAKNVQDIEYDNFKNSVDDNDRHDAYIDVWTAMYRYQHRQ
jgi:hypothetical protein